LLWAGPFSILGSLRGLGLTLALIRLRAFLLVLFFALPLRVLGRGFALGLVLLRPLLPRSGRGLLLLITLGLLGVRIFLPAGIFLLLLFRLGLLFAFSPLLWGFGSLILLGFLALVFLLLAWVLLGWVLLLLLAWLLLLLRVLLGFILLGGVLFGLLLLLLLLLSVLALLLLLFLFAFLLFLFLLLLFFLGRRLLFFFQLLFHEVPVELGLGVLREKLEGAFIGLQGFLELLLTKQRIAQVIVGPFPYREIVTAQRGAEVLAGLLEIFLPVLGNPEIKVALRVGVGGDGLFEFFGGLGIVLIVISLLALVLVPIAPGAGVGEARRQADH